ncbi:phospholipase D-like domain-containing protein [Streptomyces paromomycinus]|uniref:phospholipase D-like domain-containing protein n=1 Tax=Streptomyces paromomycinus TaxID=92743 RepID=UPI001FE4A74D|nr:phospholipase D-like domain-containing protein [Streptomyces paromomycinus]
MNATSSARSPRRSGTHGTPKPANQKLIADLRTIVDVVVPMNVMHQKIAVIDERMVMLGSLNVLSQRWTREVMLTMRGAHFARKLLEHEHAAVFAAPLRPAAGGAAGRRSRSAAGRMAPGSGAVMPWPVRPHPRAGPTRGPRMSV